MTGMGAVRLVVVPSPSCPLLLLPQHCTPPVLRSAQAWVEFSATATVTVAGSLNISGPEAPSNPADLNGDGTVSASDLAILLSNWGNPGGLGDIDGDGTVGATDLGALLNAWTA